MADESERRHDYSDITGRLTALEADASSIKTQVAVIFERTAGTQNIKRAVTANIFVVITGLVALGIAWGDLHARIDQMDYSDIDQKLTIALGVLKDHGSEFALLRTEADRFRGELDNMRQQFHTMIERRTDDRFRRRDFEAANAVWQEKFKNLELRLSIIEDEHRELFHGEQKRRRHRGEAP